MTQTESATPTLLSRSWKFRLRVYYYFPGNSVFYFYSKLSITNTVPALMYFIYMALTSYGFFCLTGTIGFYGCYLFVRQIYGSVKID